MRPEKLFIKYEKKLKLKNVVSRNIEVRDTDDTVVQPETFMKPSILRTNKTLNWDIQTANIKYKVKYTPYRGKRPKIPERMWNVKRAFSPRRDAHIAYFDAILQPEKPPKEPFSVYFESTAHEFTKQELRGMDEFSAFFENWDEGIYTPDDKEELMYQAVMGRVEVYQEFYKQTSDLIYLAKAVFIRFLDLEMLSDLHKMYLCLSEECEFSMCYVEGILRRHYEPIHNLLPL